MYITNQPKIARIAENAGVDRIFVDMEYIGKSERQGGMDTVQLHHTTQDVFNIKGAVESAEVLVRVNPIHDANELYESSEEEINAVVKSGADVLMLPYFKTVQEVERFAKIVAGRTKTMLLIETPEAVASIDEILQVPGIDEVHIGLNDLSLGYGKKFMFELLTDGTVERLCLKFKQKGISYGFGGIAALGKGMLPAEHIIKEHYRLGSSCVILSRSFCNTSQIQNMDEIRSIFDEGVKAIRDLERECQKYRSYFTENYKILVEKVEMICKRIDS